jgi:hypothetical protein
MYRSAHAGAWSDLIIPQLFTLVIAAGNGSPAQVDYCVKWFHRLQVFIHGMAKIYSCIEIKINDNIEK